MIENMVALVGIEPTASSLRTRASAKIRASCLVGNDVAELVEQCPFNPQIFSVSNNLQGSPGCHKFLIIRS